MALFFCSCEKIIIEGKVDLKRTSNIVLDYPDVVEVHVPVLYIKSASVNTLSANMVDHSVGAWDELHESKASEALVFCFDNASPEKSCFVDGLVCVISLCLLVFVFLNATRRDRNCPAFASNGK